MLDGSLPRQSAAAPLLNLPNIITFGRLCAVPLAFWLVVEHHGGYAFVLFVVAGASDALDGWLARRRGSNPVGAAMDPVADKALLVTMFVTLAAVGTLPVWLTVLVVFRDLLIIGGFIVLAVLGHVPAIHPLFVSKLNTFLQILLIAASLLRSGWNLGIPGAADVLIWCVAVSTLISGAAYVWNTARGV